MLPPAAAELLAEHPRPAPPVSGSPTDLLNHAADYGAWCGKRDTQVPGMVSEQAVMDISDRATQQEELAREEALRQIRLPEKPAATSLLYCVDCGARIPKRRRLAVPGCTRCVGCQAYQEIGYP